MKKQKNRSMKVYSQNGRNYKATPTIILKGQWLEEMGFAIGDYISVSCENGKLVITPDTERAELEQMKADFMEISLKKIDAKYFNIVLLDNKDITLQSRNTGHYWYLHCTEYPEEQSLIIFHKHFFKCPYHQHGKANTLNQAVRSIKEHDKFQLEVRKCV